MNLRSGKALGEPKKSVIMTDQPVFNQIVMTPEMLQDLIGRLQVGQGEVAVNNNTNGNFSRCTARFSGKPGENVEAFIDSITVYKDCVHISEENAKKGLSMLLTEQAAVWWMGIKDSVENFEQAITSLRSAFGYAKPAHQIYRELFSHEQGYDENTDLFISKARALFSQLPKNPEVPEVVKLDMVYGLLHHRIRDKVPRDKVVDFKSLIEAARVAEQTLHEKKNKPLPNVSGTSNSGFGSTVRNHVTRSKSRIQCSNCRNYGHHKEECKKGLKTRQEQNSQSPLEQSDAPKSTDSSKGSNGKSLVCFGCGKVGYVRSNCPNCKNKITEASTVDTEVSTTEFFSQSLDQDHKSCNSRPILRINIAGTNGYAFVDTGAKSSIAGAMLRKILLNKRMPYKVQNMLMTLADGKERQVEAFIFQVVISIEQMQVPINLISVTEHENSRTLLGVDFIKAAGIVLDVSENQWYFKVAAAKKYSFANEADLNARFNTAVSSVQFKALQVREDEGRSLTQDQKNSFNELLIKNQDIFETSREPTPYAEHAIKLLDDTPISVPPYRMSEKKMEVLKQELDKLLEEDIIEECDSPYAAPVVLVPKKDGGVRLCIDYQRLNAITQSDKYPLPRMDNLLQAAKQTRFMSTMDLRSGYHQVSVRETDRDKTGFITPYGLFRYKRMPFGLKNAPSTFQRLIDRFRAGLQDLFILAYLDDIILLSPTYEEHLNDIQKMFDRLRLFKLRLNRKKCKFATNEVKYLGHLITADGIQPDPGKIAAIVEMKPPQNVRQLLTFLQTCSWFRRFVQNFADMARPLTTLTKKNVKWQWGKHQEEAFDSLKRCLTTPPVLRQVDFRLPFVLKTDASSYALGGVLLQGEGPDERPIEYASRLLTSSERNYHTTEREALAVVWACDKFRGYLEGSSVVVKSDHQPLKWLLSLKSPSGRLARWALALQSYDLRIDYTPGKTNVIADTLSRPPIATEGEIVANVVSIEMPRQQAELIRAEQLSDPDIQKIVDCFESPTPNNVDYKRWTERGYLMDNGILYRYDPECDVEEPQQVVPRCRVTTIIKEYHDSPLTGHGGVDKTLDRIRKRYFWIGMRKDVTQYIAKCLNCQRFKPTNLKPAGLLQTPIQSRRFEVLAIDLFGPLPEAPTGERWIYIVEDLASRWVELFALKAATAEACSRVLIDEIIFRYGVPRKVISDNGVQFVSNVMQHTAYCLGFEQSLVPVYHPESNPVERKNRDLKVQLSILVQDEHSNWVDKLPVIRFSMNTSKCASTGYTPAYLTFGRELRVPDDVKRDLRAIIEQDNFIPQITPYLLTLPQVMRNVRDNHEKAQDKAKLNTDEHRRQLTFDLGEKVLVETHILSNAKKSITSKFAPRRDGPYVISKIVSPTTYEVSDSSGETLGKYHVSALQKYRPSETHEDSEPLRPIRKRGRPRRENREEEEAVSEDPEDEIPIESEDEGNREETGMRMRRRISAPKCSCCE